MIQNPTRCFFNFKFWRIVFFSIQNLTRCKITISKSCFSLRKQKMQKMSFSRCKKNQNVIFWMQTFFRSLTFRKYSLESSNTLLNFMSKSDALQKFQFNFSRFVLFFNSKSDKLCKIWFQILRFKKEKKAKNIDFTE